MKYLALILCCLSIQLTFAHDYSQSIQINNTDEYNELDSSEQSKLGLLIDSWVVTNIYESGFEKEGRSIDVKYACSQVPLMRVFCNITITTEGGGLAALSVTYDRNTDEPTIVDSSSDF